MTTEPARRGAVKSADRTLRILELLAGSDRRLSLGEISAELSIPKSSLHGLLRTLRARDWVSADETGLRFGIGVRVLLVGMSFAAADDMVRLSDAVLDDLSATLDETLHLGCLDGDQIVYVAKREASHRLRLISAVGVRLPAASTALGKALLAERPPAEIEALVPAQIPALTPATITTRRQLLLNLAEIRANGYAVDNEESTSGVRCFAVAVGPKSPSSYAISCSIPTARLDAKLEDRVVAALLQARTRMAERFSRASIGASAAGVITAGPRQRG